MVFSHQGAEEEEEGGDGSSGSIPGIYGISAYGLSLFFRWSFEYTSFVWHF